MGNTIILKATSEKEVGIYSVEDESGKNLGKVYELKNGGALFIGSDKNNISIIYLDVKEKTFSENK